MAKNDQGCRCCQHVGTPYGLTICWRHPDECRTKEQKAIYAWLCKVSDERMTAAGCPSFAQHCRVWST